jgi:tetratricopeptide (TPR) repeat protein
MKNGNTQQSRTKPNKPVNKTAPHQPLKSDRGDAPSQNKKPKTGLHKVIASIMMIFGAFMLLGALVGWFGFTDGEDQYYAYQTLTVDAYLANQFEMAVDEFTAGNYLLARERLSYVLSERPDYQPAIDLMQDINQLLNIEDTPTPVVAQPTTTPTPTQDFRPAEDQYDTVVSLISSENWDQALDAIANLRKLYPDYEAVNVDGMVYMALRNRGVEKILNRGDLEGGIYDFTLAENFGPLDGQAENYRTWARLYLLGNAYWGAYPDEAAYYYGQVAAAAPSLTDASGVSSFYRYWASLLQQAEVLATEEKWCQASDKMVHVLGSWDQAYVYPTATWVYQKCLLGTPSVTPTLAATMTATPTFTTVPGSASATPTSTQSGGPAGTSTPTFTPTNTFTPVPPTFTFTPEGPAATATPTPTDTNTSGE